MPSPAPTPVRSIQGGVWTRVYTFWFPLAWQSVVIRTSSSPFRWKVYGAGPPFYMEDRSSGFVEIPIGWANPYVEIHIRTDTSTTYTVVTQGF